MWQRLRPSPGFPSQAQLAALGAARSDASQGGLIVGFHTPDPVYTAEAARLRRSLDLLNLPHEIVTVAPKENWVRNAGQKPAVLSALRKRHRGPILYVDVDAVFHRDPWPDLAAHAAEDVALYRTDEGELLSGTVLINDTPAAARLLDAWQALCEAEPETWDQRALDMVLRRSGSDLVIGALPVSYCWIFDRRGNDGQDVVVEHLQASREGGEKKLGLFTPSRLRRRRKRIEMIERTLFAR